ncbi:MAG: hypothetical protein RLZZ136_1712 [Pseudomonadota bacterium]
MSDSPDLPIRSSLTQSGIPEGEPPETYVDLGKDYPLALIVGGLGLGILAGAVLPRGLGRKLARGAIAASAIAIEAGRHYSTQVAQAAEEGREKFGGLKNSASAYGHTLANSAEQSVRKSRASAMNTIGKVIKLVSDLRR